MDTLGRKIKEIKTSEEFNSRIKMTCHWTCKWLIEIILYT